MMQPPIDEASALDLNDPLAVLLERLVDWSAADPQPAFWAIGAAEHLPDDLRSPARRLLSRVPERYAGMAGRYYDDLARSEEELEWRALGFLVEEARALRFRRVLTGSCPDPLLPVYKSADVLPDSEGLIQSRMLVGERGRFQLGEYDVEVARSTHASNSTYWLVPFVLGRPSCRVRLDPLRFAPRGELGRMFYAMVVYGPPFDWERILGLHSVETVQWFADDGERVEPDLITELVWKPRGDEIVLEIEELPSTDSVAIDGARYLHAVLDRKRQHFVHLDGAIRWYDQAQLASRRQTRLDRSGACGIRTKIFRLDEELSRDDALDIMAAFFVWNRDVARYFDPTSPLGGWNRTREIRVTDP